MMWGYGVGSGWMVVLSIAALLGLALLILITVRIFGGGSSLGSGPNDFPRRPTAPAPRSNARLILDERFARGELSAEAYRENLRVLGDEN